MVKGKGEAGASYTVRTGARERERREVLYTFKQPDLIRTHCHETARGKSAPVI